VCTEEALEKELEKREKGQRQREKREKGKEKKDPFKLMAEMSERRSSLICAPRLPFLSY